MELLRLLRRASEDHEFADRLKKHPQTALREVGIDPTPERLQALKDLEAVLRSTSRPFESGEFADNV